MKRIFVLCLALAFLLSFTVVAYADNSAVLCPPASFLNKTDIVISSRIQKE